MEKTEVNLLKNAYGDTKATFPTDVFQELKRSQNTWLDHAIHQLFLSFLPQSFPSNLWFPVTFLEAIFYEPHHWLPENKNLKNQIYAIHDQKRILENLPEKADWFMTFIRLGYGQIDPFISNAPFLYLWKHQKTLQFCDVFRRYRKGPLGLIFNINGLILPENTDERSDVKCWQDMQIFYS